MPRFVIVPDMEAMLRVEKHFVNIGCVQPSSLAIRTHAMSEPLQPFSIMTLTQACIVRKTPVQLTSSTCGSPANDQRARLETSRPLARLTLRKLSAG